MDDSQVCLCVAAAACSKLRPASVSRTWDHMVSVHGLSSCFFHRLQIKNRQALRQTDRSRTAGASFSRCLARSRRSSRTAWRRSALRSFCGAWGRKAAFGRKRVRFPFWRKVMGLDKLTHRICSGSFWDLDVSARASSDLVS